MSAEKRLAAVMLQPGPHYAFETSRAARVGPLRMYPLLDLWTRQRIVSKRTPAGGRSYWTLNTFYVAEMAEIAGISTCLASVWYEGRQIGLLDDRRAKNPYERNP